VGETPRRLPEGWMKVETRTGRTTQKRPLVTVDTATAVVAAVGCMGRIWTVTLCPNKALTRRLSRTHGQPPSAAPSRATFSQQAEAAPLANQGMARAATRAGMLNVTRQTVTRSTCCLPCWRWKCSSQRGRNLYLMWEGKRLEINLCSLTCRSRFCQVHRPQLGARTARALSEFCSCAHLHCAPLSPPPKCRADDWLLAQPSCPLAKPNSPPPLVLSPPLW